MDQSYPAYIRRYGKKGIEKFHELEQRLNKLANNSPNFMCVCIGCGAHLNSHNLYCFTCKILIARYIRFN